ncbi:hydroxysqualene dehydroxylase HpnE [Bryobacter aggregatus]|uniref:hydroxysqualene dehydroxylase HpnE n=1 Tax=Bryobacter aggregatus TaxID=360054 RepID=UPI0004E0B3AA|nr:hydroxysqualene dehydroxylase HpnE [Bryobacter aggregatus]
MKDAIVIGGGLAGLATATALGSLGFQVELLEAKPFLGGRATSYPIAGADGETEEIDNCQHVLLKCCVNLLDFYERMGVRDGIEFHRDFYFIEPGGRTSVLHKGNLPAPMHFLGSFLRASWLSIGEKIQLGRAMLALRRERKTRTDLDDISMLEWLQEKKQSTRVIERFWRQVLVSAINVELDQMAAAHGFQVVWLGFLAGADTYEMGIPKVRLGDLYRLEMPNVAVHERAAVKAFDVSRGVLVGDEWRTAKTYISALPPEKLKQITEELPLAYGAFEPSPITGIHLWFDRSVTTLPHGTLLDRHIQWFFNKGGGSYLMVVVSASELMLRMQRQEIIDMTVKELGEFLPELAGAKLVKAHVVKEFAATFRAKPGLEPKRPRARTAIPNFFLAGDWTRNGWPATMEGAVRSGYLAAEAASAYLGKGSRFLLPDVA